MFFQKSSTYKNQIVSDSIVPTITFDDNQPKFTFRTPRFTWTSSEFANFECSLDGFQTIEQCGSGWLGSWQRYKPDGQYELFVRGRDSNGNTGIPAKHSFRVGKWPFQAIRVSLLPLLA